MVDLKWKDAIVRVFEEEKRALHYTEIAELIAERGYRKSLGATPSDTVSATITTDINTNKGKSIFTRFSKGYYILRKYLDDASLITADEIKTKKVTNTELEKTRIINSFGIYWDRSLVDWVTTPDILGVQQAGATAVSFKDQIGVYLLHDGRETIYVGQAIDQTLGQRLKNHISDRLAGRWNRFSWFGFHPVIESGKLKKDLKFEKLTVKELGDLLEAILIETIEPRQNRKQGNLFFGLEYLQQESPELNRKRKQQMMREFVDKI
ncbi:MAG: hypothetical protein JNL95_06195 [Chitinophagales bacterium]|nr:hypothetical protein [Chitinophagales bacterium]